jgi:ACT domain-containing protein
MRAVISVVGKDHPGILAFVADFCADREVNIIDVTQKVLQDMFTMTMIVQIPQDDEKLKNFSKDLEDAGEKEALKIHVMHEDIFNAMHTI